MNGINIDALGLSSGGGNSNGTGSGGISSLGLGVNLGAPNPFSTMDLNNIMGSFHRGDAGRINTYDQQPLSPLGGLHMLGGTYDPNDPLAG